MVSSLDLTEARVNLRSQKRILAKEKTSVFV